MALSLLVGFKGYEIREVFQRWIGTANAFGSRNRQMSSVWDESNTAEDGPTRSRGGRYGLPTTVGRDVEKAE